MTLLRHFRWVTSVGLVLSFFVAPLGLANDSPNGYLFRSLFGDSWEKNGVIFRGWLQQGISVINNDDTENILPQGFFTQRDGFTLNQFALQIEKEPKGNVLDRRTPLPAPKSEEFDWGFTVTAIYGEDSAFLTTLGFDDDFDSIDGATDEKLTIPQWFLSLYLPFADGTSLIIGSFQTPLENEIGYPFDPPTPFYTHAYSFAHGPAKHVGALAQIKLPTDNPLSIELGVVNGWNKLDGEQNDPHLIAGLRWRSKDMRTWLDVETIYGNGENDFGPAPATGGSPYFALSSTGETLERFAGFVTFSHVFDDKRQIIVEGSYGRQEGGDLAPAPMFITEDADWYGVNVNYFYQAKPNLKFGVRGEWFNDDEGAHVLLAGSPGDYYALTGSISWWPNKHIRIRPEMRYDIYDGDGLPAFADKTEDEQLLVSMDLTLFF